MTESNADHIVFIGQQRIDFDKLKANHSPDSLPPIYSYFINEVGGENFYDEFKKICRDGKSSKYISQKSQNTEMLSQIQYDISSAIFRKHKDRIDEGDRDEYKKQLSHRKK